MSTKAVGQRLKNYQGLGRMLRIGTLKIGTSRIGRETKHER